jgi:hypothetical protein
MSSYDSVSVKTFTLSKCGKYLKKNDSPSCEKKMTRPIRIFFYYLAMINLQSIITWQTQINITLYEWMEILKSQI